MRGEYMRKLWENKEYLKDHMSPLKTVIGLREEGVFTEDEAKTILESSHRNEDQIETCIESLCEKDENTCFLKFLKCLRATQQSEIAATLTTGIQNYIDDDERGGKSGVRTNSLSKDTNTTQRAVSQTGSTSQTNQSLRKQLEENEREKLELLEKLMEKESEVESLSKELKSKHEDILWMRDELDRKQKSLDTLKDTRRETLESIRKRSEQRGDRGTTDKTIQDLEKRLEQKDEEIGMVTSHIAELAEKVNRLAMEKEEESSSTKGQTGKTSTRLTVNKEENKSQPVRLTNKQLNLQPSEKEGGSSYYRRKQQGTDK